MSSTQQRILTEEAIAKWPLYAPLNVWCEVLDLTRLILFDAMRRGLLHGDKPGLRSIYFTKKQILKWYAPAVFEEMYGTVTESKLTRVKG